MERGHGFAVIVNPAGKVYQLSIRHPDGATQQLDISEKNYRALNLKT